MAHKHLTTCDGPGCGKDITEGDGVNWRLVAQGEMIPVRQGSKFLPHLGYSPPQHHFCGMECLAAWAMDMAAKASEREVQIAKAAAERPKVGNQA